MLAADEDCLTNPKGECCLPMPYRGASQQAAAIWSGVPAVYNPIDVNPVPMDTPAMAALYNAAASRENTLGGTTVEINQRPYYDPRTTTIKTIMNPSEPLVIQTTGGLKHGPDAFSYTAADVAPKTQYAPVGDIVTEAVLLDLPPPGTPCICIPQYGYSVAQLFMERSNVLKIRGLLVQTGMVNLSPALAAAGLEYCSCKILGGAETYAQLSAFAVQYMDTPVIQVPNLGVFMDFLNTSYIQNVIAELKFMVNTQARLNYLRAEGNRAFIQQDPACPGGTIDPKSYDLPEVLPVTGCTVVAEDTMFATRMLTDPISRVSNREKMSRIANLPIGLAPIAVPNVIPICKTKLNCLSDWAAGTPENPGAFLL